MSDDLYFLPATELARRIRVRELSAREVVVAVLERIESGGAINAFASVDREGSLKAAEDADRKTTSGSSLGALHGVPVSVKDLVAVEGQLFARGSRIFGNKPATFDAPVAQRLREAGAIIVGKTTTSELGFKGATDSPAFGITRNPWNPERTSGGSSGGAAAAVAAGMAPIGIGTDGGGSIRIPASFCGVFGLKPTFGLVPAYPPSAVAMLAHIGPLTRTVRDAALCMDVISGYDARDLSSFPQVSHDYLRACDGSVSGLKAAFSPDLGYVNVAPEVAAIVADSIGVLSDLGCAVEQIPQPIENPEEVYETLWSALLGAFLRPYLVEFRETMDEKLVERVDRSADISADTYARMLLRRNKVAEDIGAVFSRHDILVTPTLPITAFEATATIANGREVDACGWTPFTYPFNLAGCPAATVPCGFTSEGLPVGLQIIAPRYRDDLVLKICASFEEAKPWSHVRPRRNLPPIGNAK